jgi:hypothetical protein
MRKLRDTCRSRRAPSFAQLDVGSGPGRRRVGAAIGGIAGGGRGAATGAIVGGSVGTVTGAFSPTAAVIQIGRLFGNEIGTAFIQTFQNFSDRFQDLRPTGGQGVVPSPTDDGGPFREAQMGSR